MLFIPQIIFYKSSNHKFNQESSKLGQVQNLNMQEDNLLNISPKEIIVLYSCHHLQLQP